MTLTLAITPPEAAPRRSPALYALAFAVTLLLVLVAVNSKFNHDEIEHAHSAWYVAQGALPYRDFFEHHHPLLWYLAAPLFKLMADDESVLIVLRMVMVAMSLGTAATAAAVARRLSAKPGAALTCYILLLSCMMFTRMGVEIRPDVPMVMLETLSLYYFLRALDSSAMKHVVLCGVCAAVAYWFLQKALFFVAALSLLTIIAVVRKELRGRAALVLLACVGGGIALLFLVFASHGALHDYYLTNFLVNKRKLSSFSTLRSMHPMWVSLAANSGFWLLGAAGVGIGLASFKRGSRVGYVALLGLLLYLSVVRVDRPWEQYYLPALVMLAVVGAWTLTHLSDWVRPKIAGILRFMLLASVALVTLLALHKYATNRNAAQLARIRYATQTTKPDDLVYDGDANFNVFRKDLHYFWFSTRPNWNLSFYNRLTSNRFGDYDICSLLAEKQPVLIADTMIDRDRCPAFRYYQQDEQAKAFRLYRRVEGP